MAKQFCPEFVEVIVYSETARVAHNHDSVSVKVTQHHEHIYMLELQHLTYGGECEKVNIRRLFYLPYKKDKIIRLAVGIIDDYCMNYTDNGLKYAVEVALKQLKTFSEMYEENVYIDYNIEGE